VEFWVTVVTEEPGHLMQVNKELDKGEAGGLTALTSIKIATSQSPFGLVSDVTLRGEKHQRK
jgi:hypothetical protein